MALTVCQIIKTVSRYQLYLPDVEMLKQELRRLLDVNRGSALSPLPPLPKGEGE
jgi:hypothetical protein